MDLRATLTCSALLALTTVVALGALLAAAGHRRAVREGPAAPARAAAPAAALPPEDFPGTVDRLLLEGPVLEESAEEGAPAPGLVQELAELPAEEAYQELHILAADDATARSLAGELEQVAAAARLDERLRGLAVWALSRTGDLRAAEAGIAAGSAPGLRLTAIEMLRRHGGARTSLLLAPLARSDADRAVREAALRALWLHDASGAEPLCRDIAGGEVAGQEDDPLREVALEFLARLEPPPERPKNRCALTR
jgi:hypothetical protein